MNAQDLQSQQLRHQYLQAMGISSWLPREPLAGARPSADWVWQFQQGATDGWDDGESPESDIDDVAPDAGAVSTAGRSSGAGRAALLDSLDASPGSGSGSSLDTVSKTAPARPATPASPAVAPPRAVPSPATAAVARAPQANSQAASVAPSAAPSIAPSAPTASAAPVQPEAVPRARRPEPQLVPEFKLAFLSMGDGLIIDSLPPQSRGGFSPAHLRLAMSLWRALGMPAAEPPRAQLLPWPAFTSRSLDQGWDQAQTAVQRKFDLMLQQSPARFVLLLGDAAARLLLQSPEGGDGMRGMLFRPRSQVPALATASLSEMLQVPGCKRDVWRDLQPLMRHLTQAPPVDG